MLGVNAHIWRKLITCKTLKTSQHGKVPQIAFTFDSNCVHLFSPSAGFSLIPFRNIRQQSTVKKPPSKCTISRQEVYSDGHFRIELLTVLYVYCLPYSQTEDREGRGGGVNICFHISTEGWAIWCLNRLRLNWKYISCSAPCVLVLRCRQRTTENCFVRQWCFEIIQ